MKDIKPACAAPSSEEVREMVERLCEAEDGPVRRKGLLKDAADLIERLAARVPDDRIATLEQRVAELENVISEHGADMWAQGEEYAALSAKCAQAMIQAGELEQQVAVLTKELQKRDKCSYMGPMRDCPTHGIGPELAALTKERDAWREDSNISKTSIDMLKGQLEHKYDQLDAAQAREAMLRTYIAQGLGNYSLRVAAADLLVEAIALPTDDSALKERLKQERERVWEVVDRELEGMSNNATRDAVQDAIRGLA